MSALREVCETAVDALNDLSVLSTGSMNRGLAIIANALRIALATPPCATKCPTCGAPAERIMESDDPIIMVKDLWRYTETQ